VEQAVPANHQIDLWKFRLRQIGVEKSDPRICMLNGVCFDHPSDDVGANVFDPGTFTHNVLHPFEIAARCIEHAADGELIKQLGQFASEDLGLLERRAKPTETFVLFVAAPIAALAQGCKPICQGTGIGLLDRVGSIDISRSAKRLQRCSL
jgi:hypothetical protein